MWERTFRLRRNEKGELNVNECKLFAVTQRMENYSDF